MTHDFLKPDGSSAFGDIGLELLRADDRITTEFLPDCGGELPASVAQEFDALLVLAPRVSAATEEGATRTQPRFLPSIETFDASDERARAALSDRVRRDEIFAFVEIPADALDPDTKSTVSYYSNHPGYRTLPGTNHPEVMMPVHQHCLAEAGVYLIENMVMDGVLAAGKSSFCFMLAPVKFKGATGCPVRPVAVV